MKKSRVLLSLILALSLAFTSLPFCTFLASATDTDLPFLPFNTETAVLTATATEKDGKVIFSVVTTEGYNRVKVSTEDHPTGSLAVGTNGFRNGDGTVVWTIKLAAPESETVYVFDARKSDTNVYTKTYHQFTYNPQSKTVSVLDVTSEVKSDKLYLYVKTAAGFNRVKVAYASSPSESIAVGSVPVDNGDDTFTWTVKLALPSEKTAFVFDARDAVKGAYIKDYYSFNYVPEANSSGIKSVSHTVENGKILFSVTTVAGFNRVKVASASAPNTSLAVGTLPVDNGNGTYTWTIKLADPGQKTDYSFDARSSETNLFVKNYFSYTYVPQSVKIVSVSHKVEGEKAIYSVTTGEGYSRVAMYLSSARGTALTTSYSSVANGNGTVTWLVKLDAPQAETSYSFDVRSAETGKYLKDYFDYTFKPAEPESMLHSVKVDYSGSYSVFTVVTAPVFNRIKISTLDNPSGYIKYTNDYTVLTSGEYEWVIQIETPDENTTYSFDGRLQSTDKYAKDYYTFDLVLPAEPEKTINSVDCAVVGNKLEFTVVTSNRFNRVKVSSADSSILFAYVNKYVELQNGNRQWTLSVDVPDETTTYVFDARLISTLKYTKNTASCTFNLEQPHDYIVSKAITIGAYYISVITTTTADCSKVSVSYGADSTLVSKEITNYSVASNGNRMFTATFAAPSEDTVFTVNVYGAGSTMLETANISYFAGIGGIDHEII